MTTYWQQLDGKFVKVKKDDVKSSAPLWIDMRMVSTEETDHILTEYNLEKDTIQDILDPDELSRMEDCENYILTIVRVPVYQPGTETPYFTVPIGIIIKGKTIITMCWTDSEVIKDFGNNRIKGVRLNDFPSFIVQIMNRANLNFLRYLKEINRKSISIQGEMKEHIQNKEIMEILGLEKALFYFSTSLKSNSLLLEKMKSTKLIKFDDEDIDFVEGVSIDNRQAIEMTETYSNIMFGVMDAYNSIISNNLNIVMKKLAVLNLVMMAPTFITSFFGMNFRLPFDNLGGYLPVICATITCIASVIIAFLCLDISDEEKKLKREVNKRERKAKRK